MQTPRKLRCRESVETDPRCETFEHNGKRYTFIHEFHLNPETHVTEPNPEYASAPFEIVFANNPA